MDFYPFFCRGFSNRRLGSALLGSEDRSGLSTCSGVVGLGASCAAAIGLTVGLAVILNVAAVPAEAQPINHQASFGEKEMLSPKGLTVDGSGNVFVNDTANCRIQKFLPTGALLLEFGSAGAGVGELDSNGNFLFEFGGFGSAEGEFSGTRDVAIGADGSLYVTDSGNDRIQKFDSSGNFLAKWGSEGTADGRLMGPWDIAIDGNDNLYVTDINNHRVQKFTCNGGWIATLGSEGTADGQFEQADAIAVQGPLEDGSTTLFVSDHGGRVQRFSDVNDFIFVDGFESGGLTAWSSSSSR